jgi:hypothetical protein
MNTKVEDKIYLHYSKHKLWGSAHAISAGTAFRLMHQIASTLDQLDLSASKLSISSWRKRTRLALLDRRGVWLEQLVRFALTGTVGDLLGLTEGLECVVTDTRKRPVSSIIDGTRLPDSSLLFAPGTVTAEWMKYLRAICFQFKCLDREIGKFYTKPADLRRLTVIAYSLCISLHQALCILTYAADVSHDIKMHKKTAKKKTLRARPHIGRCETRSYHAYPSIADKQ